MALKQKSAPSIPTGLGIGLAVGIMITLIFTAIGAYLVHSETLPEESFDYIAPVVQFFGALACGWVTLKMTDRHKMQMCLLSGGLYFLTLLAMTALFFGGEYHDVGIGALAVLLGAGGVGLLSGFGGNRKKLFRKKGVYR